MPPSPSLSIVVPLYRSEASLDRLLGELTALRVEGGHELVLVDDGSADGTGALATSLAAAAPIPVTVVHLARNYGEHNAVMAGLHHARGAYVVTMDDDLQNPPSEALRLWEHARTHGLDIVYGDPVEKAHAAWRNLGSWFTNRVATALLDKPPALYLSSFRCLSAFAAREVCRYDGPFVYLDGLLLQITDRVGSLAVRHAPRAVGSSGYTMRKLVRLWLTMVMNFSVIPLRIATGLGFVVAASGFFYALEVVLEHFVEPHPLGWPSLMACVLVFSGVQLIVAGMAGEYLGRIYLTTNRRPQFTVREVVSTPGRGHDASANQSRLPRD